MSTPTTDNLPYWWPVKTDAAWCAEIRTYYEDAPDDDDEVRERYAQGCRYTHTWDHVGDAYGYYEPLADAFLAANEKLVAIRALLDGEYDHPELVKYGPLDDIGYVTIRRILNGAKQ